jgi:hypothetical protein
MARKTKQEVAKAKEAKQKKIAIVGGVLLLGLLAIQVPKMMKMMNQKPKPPILGTTAAPTTGTATPTTGTPVVDPNSLAAPTLGGTPTVTTTDSSASDLVDAVPVTVDAGQLATFERFATKDPFAAQASASGAATGSSDGGSSSSTGGKTTPVTTTPAPSTTPPPSTTPASPAPTTATISLNGELMSVGVNTDFPQSGATFNRVGAIFHLISLTAKTAKISIVGGSYADGANAITLKVGEPLTLQNTADGTKYVFILQKQGTPVPAATTTATTPTSTTSAAPVVPSSGG